MDTVPSLYFARRKKRNCSDLGCANELELLLGGQHGRKSLSRVRGKTGAGCWQVMVASPPWLNGFRCFPIIAVARSTPWQLLSTTHAPGEGHGLGILLPGRCGSTAGKQPQPFGGGKGATTTSSSPGSCSQPASRRGTSSTKSPGTAAARTRRIPT